MIEREWRTGKLMFIALFVGESIGISMCVCVCVWVGGWRGYDKPLTLSTLLVP